MRASSLNDWRYTRPTSCSYDGTTSIYQQRFLAATLGLIHGRCDAQYAPDRSAVAGVSADPAIPANPAVDYFGCFARWSTTAINARSDTPAWRLKKYDCLCI